MFSPFLLPALHLKSRPLRVALKLLIVLFHAQVFTDTPPKPTSAFYAASLECASGIFNVRCRDHLCVPNRILILFTFSMYCSCPYKVCSLV
uniref:Secreted protein n=1 Tax=Myripristis murdjan TaxID=586833 RepID=A0A667XS12_9TELE